MASNDIASCDIQMDADEGGTLDREEIRLLARSLGNQLTDSQLDQAMKEMDEDGSSEVDFEEFFDWYENNSV